MLRGRRRKAQWFGGIGDSAKVFLDALQQSLLGVADLSAGHTEKRPPLFVQVVPVLGQLLGEVFSGNPAKGDDRQSKPLDRGDARLGPRLGLRLMRFGRLAGLELGHEERHRDQYDLLHRGVVGAHCVYVVLGLGDQGIDLAP